MASDLCVISDSPPTTLSLISQYFLLEYIKDLQNPQLWVIFLNRLTTRTAPE